VSLKLSEIKRILKESDVRDPRATLLAIEKVAFQKNPDTKIKPVLRIDVTDRGNGYMEVTLCGDEDAVLPIHAHAAIKGIKGYGEMRAAKSKEYEECKGCPEAASASTPRAELFAQFEMAARKVAGKDTN
jgi:hypothetical protein